MKPLIPAVAACAWLLASGAARAGLAPAEEPAKPAEAKVERIISEDESVRIEERRFRGQTESITVKSKLRGVAPYDILPGGAGRDPSQPGGTGGQRVWHFFSF
jgi:hypothetical protein